MQRAAARSATAALCLLCACSIACRKGGGSAGAPPAQAIYRDAKRTVEERVSDLAARMTLDEKLLLVHASAKFSTAPIARLGIPGRELSDGPHGVREEMSPHMWVSAGRTDDFATWMPVGF